MTNEAIDKVLLLFKSAGYEPDATVKLVPENTESLSAGMRINGALAVIESWKT